MAELSSLALMWESVCEEGLRSDLGLGLEAVKEQQKESVLSCSVEPPLFLARLGNGLID